MKRLSRAQVIGDLEFIVTRARPALNVRAWSVAGVSCEADRHSHIGRAYAFHMDVLVLTARRPAWKLLLASQFWDAGAAPTVHVGKWLKLQDKQADVAAWIERNHDPAALSSDE